MRVNLQCSGVQISWQRVFWAGNQGIHQNFDKSLLTYKCWLIFMRVKQKKNFFFEKKKFKMADSKKGHFPAPPILNIFSWKFHGLVLGLVELIDAKGIGMAQFIWLWGCPTYAQKQAKNAYLVFLGCFWAYVGQPHDQIDWATPMPVASINSTN